MSIYDRFPPVDEPNMNEIVHSSQRQLPIQQRFNQSIPNRFYPSQYRVRNSFINICQQTRTTPPMFSAPFQCHRERFQVNSIGRPILRTKNSLQGYHLKVRR